MEYIIGIILLLLLFALWCGRYAEEAQNSNTNSKSNGNYNQKTNSRN